MGDMVRYAVYYSEVTEWVAFVEADSEESAKSLFIQGEWQDRDFVESELDLDTLTVVEDE
jgi:hypothetical protein